MAVSNTWSSCSHVIDEVNFDDDDEDEDDNTNHYPSMTTSKYASNTVEIVTSHEKAHAVNSPLNATGVKLSPHFSFNTESIQRMKNPGNSSQIHHDNHEKQEKQENHANNSTPSDTSNDLTFQNRAARAAALEKQFQSILRH